MIRIHHNSNNYYYLQVAALAALALLLAAIGGSDMLLQYIFVIYVCMHQSEVYELWIVRVVEAGSNIHVVYVAMTQVYRRAVVQAVYTRYYIILLSLCFLHLYLQFNH